MPDKTKELHTRLVKWRKEVNAPMFGRNEGPAAVETTKKKGRKKANRVDRLHHKNNNP